MHTRKKKETVFSIKTLINNEKYPPTKIIMSDNFICKYTKILRKKNCQSWINFSKEQEKRKHFIVCLWCQCNLDVKFWQWYYKKKYRLISLINMDVKTLNKTLTQQN